MIWPLLSVFLLQFIFYDSYIWIFIRYTAEHLKLHTKPAQFPLGLHCLPWLLTSSGWVWCEIQIGCVNLGERVLKMRQTKSSCNSQLYSEYQTVYILGIKEDHMSKVHTSLGCMQSWGQTMHRSRWCVIWSNPTPVHYTWEERSRSRNNPNPWYR